MDFSIKSYKGRVIRINPETKYVCLTDMAAANGKLLGGWTRLKGTSEYLEALSAAMQICIADLIQITEGGTPTEQGTWAHPEVAIEFAAWCSVGFKIQVNQWILELMTTVDILPSLKAWGFQRSLFGLPLSTTRLTWRSCLTQAEIDVSRGVFQF